jgi:hypothetical protein
LPEHPALLVLHPLKEKIPERIDGRLTTKAIINVLVIGICPEPEFICITEEQEAEE